MIFQMVQGWWADWDYNAVTDWQFTTYLTALSFYAILFACIHLLVPSVRTATFDLRSQFWAVKNWFFALMITYFVTAIYSGVVHYGTELLHPYRIFQGFLLAILIVGLSSRNEAVHRVLAILFLLANISAQILVRMNIGALMGQSA